MAIAAAVAALVPKLDHLDTAVPNAAALSDEHGRHIGNLLRARGALEKPNMSKSQLTVALDAAAKACHVRFFMTAASPGVVAAAMENRHYASLEEDFVVAH